MGKILTLLVTTILGGLIAYLLFNIFEHYVPSGEWQPVSVGQDKAVQILGMDLNSKSGSVYYYIQTSQGKVYACDDAQCDLTTASPVTRAHSAAADYTPPQPPGEVRESFIGPGHNPGLCTGQTNYIILTDGSVWTWNKVGCCEIGCLVYLIFPLGGLVLGFFMGVVILVVGGWRRRRRKALAATN